MAKYFSPYSSSGSNLDIQGLAEKSNLTAPSQEPSFFSRVVDLLNKPSQLTEKALTGGAGYEKSGLNAPLAFGARMVLDPLNLIAPLGIGSKVLKGIGVGAKVASKIKPIGTIAKGLEELFVPGAKLAKVSPQLKEALPALETLTKSRQVRTVEDIGKFGKTLSPEIRKNLDKLMEKAGTGVPLAPEELSAVQKSKDLISKSITTPEAEAGLLPETIANYFPRKTEREGVEKLLKFGGKKLSLSLGGAEKTRTFLTREAGEAAGIAYKEPLQALAMRASKSEAARANQGLLKQLISGEVKDIEGNALVQSAKGGLGQGYKEFALKELKGFQAPAEAVDEIEKFYKTFVSDEGTNALLKFYDKALGIWKGSVTSIFPAFHLRNIVGNLSNMYLGGFVNPLNPVSITKAGKRLVEAGAVQTGKAVKAGGTTVTKELLQDLGILNRGQFGVDIPQVLGGKNILSKLNPLDVGKNIGTKIENNARTAFFLDRLNKGDDIKTAVGQVKKYLFDYSNLTPFEKNIMRRTVPFYAWARNNIPLQIESLIRQPGKQASITKTFANLNQFTQEEKNALPTYLTEGLTAKGSTNERGETNVISSFGLPIEDLGRLSRGSPSRTAERELLGATGPLGNILGLITGRDLYRGKPTSELAYTYGRSSKNFPSFLKTFLDFKAETTKAGKEVYRVNPKKYQALQVVLPRLLRTINEPIGGVSFFRQTPIDIPEAKTQKENTILKELSNLLIEKGVLKNFQQAYLPKQSKSKYVSPYTR